MNDSGGGNEVTQFPVAQFSCIFIIVYKSADANLPVSDLCI